MNADVSDHTDTSSFYPKTCFFLLHFVGYLL